MDAKTDDMLEKYEACIIYFQKKQRVLYSYCISVLLFWLLSICLSVYLQLVLLIT